MLSTTDGATVPPESSSQAASRTPIGPPHPAHRGGELGSDSPGSVPPSTAPPIARNSYLIGIDGAVRHDAGVRPRITVITLGVADLRRSRAFYEALGWRSGARPDDDVVFFESGGTVLGLWDRKRLAHDSTVVDGGGWGGVTLACNVASEAAVDEAIDVARAAGAAIGREPARAFWGGYSGVFIDPDGHPWEVAHNPHWTLTAEGAVVLPG